MEKREDDLVVGGYRFATIADAETARMEIKKVENLEQRLDYRKPQWGWNTHQISRWG